MLPPSSVTRQAPSLSRVEPETMNPRLVFRKPKPRMGMVMSVLISRKVSPPSVVFSRTFEIRVRPEKKPVRSSTQCMTRKDRPSRYCMGSQSFPASSDRTIIPSDPQTTTRLLLNIRTP